MYKDLLRDRRTDPIVGIDLGTTYSLVAACSDGVATILPDAAGASLCPSVVTLGEQGDLLVGPAAQERRLSHPAEAITSIKRLMGQCRELARTIGAEVPYRVIAEDEPVAYVQLGPKRYSPPEISAFILRRLKEQAEAGLGEPVTRAVVTVPAYFNEAERQATRDAARIAGLEVARIVNEPTAAALAYGLHKNKQGVIAVYDLGGGTFDVSILRLEGGVFEVLATNGDTHLGGDDLDRTVAEWLLAEINGPSSGATLSDDPALYATLLHAAEKAKRALSDSDEASIALSLPDGRRWEGELTRERFESLIGFLVERTLGPCGRALADAGLDKSEVDEVILVGGSTRVPQVREAVGRFFGKVPRCEINPDEVVALGAAVQADILAGGIKDMLLIDVTPLSLGIETFGGAFDRIIPRNTSIPVSGTHTFTNFVEGQTRFSIHVLQGERELATDNRSLAKFSLSGVEPRPAGMARVKVTFTLDADGLLRVRAQDERSGREHKLDIKPSSGLTDEQVESVMRDAYTHAEDDLEARMLVDRRNEADSILRATEKSLAVVGDALDRDEAKIISVACLNLKATMEGRDVRALNRAIEKTDLATRHLAEIQMTEAVRAVVVDKTVSDLEEELAEGKK